MLRSWMLCATQRTATVSIAGNDIQQRAFTSIRRPSTFYKSRESTSVGAHLKAAQDKSKPTSVQTTGSSGSQIDPRRSDREDALHLLEKIEPALSVNRGDGWVPKHMVVEKKAGALIRVGKHVVEGDLPLRYTRAPAQVEAQHMPQTEVRIRKSYAKAAEAIPRRLSSLYKFDSERQLLYTTAIRRPRQLRPRAGTATDADKHVEGTCPVKSEAPGGIDLSERPQRMPGGAKIRSKAMSQSLLRRRIRQRMSAQIWRFISKRSVVIGPARLVNMGRQSRVLVERPNAKPVDMHADVRAQLKRHVAKRRLRKIYFLRVTPSAPRLEMNPAELSPLLTLDATEPDSTKESQSASPKASNDDSKLTNAINDLTSAPQSPAARVRRSTGRKARGRSLQRGREGTTFVPLK